MSWLLGGPALWIVLALVVAVAAQRFERSSLAWFGVALVLSPLLAGLLLLALGSGAVTRRCPECGETVRWEAVVCKHCRARLPDPTDLPPLSGRELNERIGSALLVLLTLLAMAWGAARGYAWWQEFRDTAARRARPSNCWQDGKDMCSRDTVNKTSRKTMDDARRNRDNP